MDLTLLTPSLPTGNPAKERCATRQVDRELKLLVSQGLSRRVALSLIFQRNPILHSKWLRETQN